MTTRWFDSLSIRHKIASLVVAATAVVLIATLVALAVFDWAQTRSWMVSDAITVARGIALNNQAALVFNDPETAASNLASLSADRRVLCAFLYTPHGEVFASYWRPDAARRCIAPPAPPFDAYNFAAGTLRISRQIKFNGRGIGSLHLVETMDFVHERWRAYASAFLLVAVSGIGIALAISVRAQRAISDPILSLAAIARRVTRENNYSLRAQGDTADEVGTLIACFNRMLSEIQVRDENLRRSEEQTRLILESLADGVLGAQADGAILSVNHAAEVLFCASRATLVGQRISDLLLSNVIDSTAVVRAGTSLCWNGSSGEAMGVKCDGALFPAEVAVSNVGAGELVTYVVRDLSERKAAVAEQTRLESQLRQSQKMEAVGVLAGGVAHDFNNLLAAILGHTRLAKKRAPMDSPAHKNLDIVIQASHRATDLVKQLLTFSRQSDAARTHVDVAAVIDESLALIKASVSALVEMQVEVEDRCPGVLADATQLQQILINLCTNSCHAMGTGGGKIVIGLRSIQTTEPLSVHGGSIKPGHYVELSVADDGSGIDAATQVRIFEPFFTTKGVGEGTGLGLAVVHGIVTSAGGGIAVESAPGDGTVFRIYLPADDQATEEKPDENTVTASDKRESARILLVDDEEMVASMAAEVLEELGYVVTVYHDPNEALACYRADPFRFDVLLTDHSMPGMSGLDLARECRRLRLELPIIVASGYGVVTAMNAAELGLSGFMAKPYEPDAMGELVRSVLGSNQKGGSGDAASPDHR